MWGSDSSELNEVPGVVVEVELEAPASHGQALTNAAQHEAVLAAQVLADGLDQDGVGPVGILHVHLAHVGQLVADESHRALGRDHLGEEVEERHGGLLGLGVIFLAVDPSTMPHPMLDLVELGVALAGQPDLETLGFQGVEQLNGVLVELGVGGAESVVDVEDKNPDPFVEKPRPGDGENVQVLVGGSLQARLVVVGVDAEHYGYCQPGENGQADEAGQDLEKEENEVHALGTSS